MREKELAEEIKMDTMKMELIGTACEELLTYGLWNYRKKAKIFIKKYALRQQTPANDPVFWPTGLLASGLWHCRRKLLNCKTEDAGAMVNRIEAALLAYFTRWEKKKFPVYYLDDLLAGEVFLAILEEYQDDCRANGIINEKNVGKYRKAVDKLAEYAFSYPTDETGSFPYRAARKNGHIYVDTIGLSCPFLYEYGRVYEKDEGMELAVAQIANFLAYGIDTTTELPYHGYEVESGMKYGIIGWGRAVGWLLRGMIRCMTAVYGLDRLQESYCRLMDVVIAWQRKDGYFSWQLQAMEGPADTSATAMICLALQEGIRTRMLQGEAYQIVLDKGLHALRKSIKNGRVYDSLGECEGFSQYPQNYGAYPWALGVVLMLEI